VVGAGMNGKPSNLPAVLNSDVFVSCNGVAYPAVEIWLTTMSQKVL